MTGGETVTAGPGPSDAADAASAAAAGHVRRGLEAVRAQEAAEGEGEDGVAAYGGARPPDGRAVTKWKKTKRGKKGGKTQHERRKQGRR